jgi:transcriptional regulator with XRE-family HTH domain
MDPIKLAELAERIQSRRKGKGIREIASEIGISPATLSRVENQKVPDLETFRRVCVWLGEDPAVYLGMRTVGESSHNTARVHFKKNAAIEPDSAKALGEMILAAQRAMLEEEDLGA